MSDRYAIRITARAARDVRRLPEKIATACIGFVFGALAENLWRVGKPLRGEWVGLHSARRGDHRVVYPIVHDTRTVQIVRVGRRGDI